MIFTIKYRIKINHIKLLIINFLINNLVYKELHDQDLRFRIEDLFYGVKT